MAREIRLNAFDMNCVGHQSPGLWAHPRDRSWQYKDLEYWTDLAKILERGKFDGLFIADVLGIYDVYNGNGDAAIRQAAQVPVNDPLQLIPPMALLAMAVSAAVSMVVCAAVISAAVVYETDEAMPAWVPERAALSRTER